MVTTRLIEIAVTSSPTKPLLLNNLTSALLEADLHPSGGSWGWEIRIASLFFSLPALRKFVGSGCRDTDENLPWTCKDGQSGVIHVELNGCKIGADSIRRLLRACRALETFKCIRFSKEMYDQFIPCDYSHAEIHHDLLRHRSTLCCLHLHSKYELEECTLDDEPIKLGALASLEALEELEVDEDVLYGRYGCGSYPFANLLPPNLKRLTVKCECEPYQELLFFEMRRALLSNPNLPPIEVLSWMGEEVEELFKDLQGVGIRKTSWIEISGPPGLSFTMFRVGG